jgi:hypothetical protein
MRSRNPIRRREALEILVHHLDIAYSEVFAVIDEPVLPYWRISSLLFMPSFFWTLPSSGGHACHILPCPRLEALHALYLRTMSLRLLSMLSRYGPCLMYTEDHQEIESFIPEFFS